jgi:hypothetical protein
MREVYASLAATGPYDRSISAISGPSCRQKALIERSKR